MGVKVQSGWRYGFFVVSLFFFISNEGNKDLVVVKPLPFRTYFVVRCVVAEPPWQMEFGWWGDERCGKYA